LLNPNDSDRAEIASDGSAAEFAAHYRDAYKKLTCIAAGVLGHFEDAEDMVQQAVSIALDKGERFQTGSHFVAWLCTAVRHCALNHRRKMTGRKTVAADPVVMSTMLDESSRGQPLERVTQGKGELLPDQQSFDDRVIRALQTLTPDSRSCLLLRIVENMSYVDIAALMQIPEGTAMSHVHRGKKKLRELLHPSRERQGGEA